MGRLIGAIVLGYIVMFVFVFVSFTVVYIGMGTERAFQPGSYDVSGLWIAASISLGLVAAVIGGYVSARVARGSKGPRYLSAFVLIIGLAMAVPALTSSEEPPEVRTGEVGNLEAMQGAQQPTWMVILNPFLGAVGVLIGGRMRRSA